MVSYKTIIEKENAIVDNYLSVIDEYVGFTSKIINEDIKAVGNVFNQVFDMYIPVKVVEEDDQILVNLDLPDVKKESIKMRIIDDVLDITAHRDEQKISRKVRLPYPIKDIQAIANYKDDGTLEIKIPIKETAQVKLH